MVNIGVYTSPMDPSWELLTLRTKSIKNHRRTGDLRMYRYLLAHRPRLLAQEHSGGFIQIHSVDSMYKGINLVKWMSCDMPIVMF